MIEINGQQFELIEDYKNGWDIEVFKERYSEVLDRFDYIVGDWGYDQMRLKGFYHSGHAKVPKDSLIDSLRDYLHEYCNFGCAYFVIKRIKDKEAQPSSRGRRR